MPHLDNDDPPLCKTRLAQRGVSYAAALRRSRYSAGGQHCAAAGRKPFFKKGILFDSDNPAGSCPRSVGSACPKASQSFANGAAKESLDHFLRRHVRLRKYRSACKRARHPPRRTARALQQAANPFVKKVLLFDSNDPAGSCPRGDGSACSKNLVEFRRRSGERKSQSFSPATCAAEKILLRLQVWNLCAVGAQIMRAADCSPFVKKEYFLTATTPQAIACGVASL